MWPSRGRRDTYCLPCCPSYQAVDVDELQGPKQLSLFSTLDDVLEGHLGCWYSKWKAGVRCRCGVSPSINGDGLKRSDLRPSKAGAEARRATLIQLGQEVTRVSVYDVLHTIISMREYECDYEYLGQAPRVKHILLFLLRSTYDLLLYRKICDAKLSRRASGLLGLLRLDHRHALSSAHEHGLDGYLKGS